MDIRGHEVLIVLSTMMKVKQINHLLGETQGIAACLSEKT